MLEKNGVSAGEICTQEVDPYETSVLSKGGTAEDRYDMRRVGKKQELRVRRCLSSYVV